MWVQAGPSGATRNWQLLHMGRRHMLEKVTAIGGTGAFVRHNTHVTFMFQRFLQILQIQNSKAQLVLQISVHHEI